MRTLSSSDEGFVAQRALAMPGWLAITLVFVAALLVAGVLVQPNSVGLPVIGVALVLAAAACWRLGTRIVVAIHESRAWSEVASLQSALARRAALWSDLPAASAVWDVTAWLWV